MIRSSKFSPKATNLELVFKEAQQYNLHIEFFGDSIGELHQIASNYAIFCLGFLPTPCPWIPSSNPTFCYGKWPI
jgi:hypothetical protein